MLYDKTQIVKNLSVLVEKAFNDYANNSDRVVQSTTHLYYDAKSPKTFCDTAQMYNQSRNAKLPDKSMAHKSAPNRTTTSSTTTTGTTTTQTPKNNKRSDNNAGQFKTSTLTKSINNPLEIQFNLKSSSSDVLGYNGDGQNTAPLTIENYDPDDKENLELEQSEKGFYYETGIYF